jgi:hypothetical protein
MTNDIEAGRKILLALKVKVETRPMRRNMSAGDNNNDQAIHRQGNSDFSATKPSEPCGSAGENLDDDLKYVALFVERAPFVPRRPERPALQHQPYVPGAQLRAMQKRVHAAPERSGRDHLPATDKGCQGAGIRRRCASHERTRGTSVGHARHRCGDDRQATFSKDVADSPCTRFKSSRREKSSRRQRCLQQWTADPCGPQVDGIFQLMEARRQYAP